MITVGVREAKDRMAELIDRTLAGEEVIVTRRGKRVVRMEAVSEEEKSRFRNAKASASPRSGA